MSHYYYTKQSSEWVVRTKVGQASKRSSPHLVANVEFLLGKHPDQTGRRHNQGAGQALVKLAVLEPQPLGEKVEPRNDKGPNTEVVHGLIAHQAVGTVESDNGGQERPRTKSPGAQIGHFRLGCRRVHLTGETKIFDQVRLGRVENRHHRDEKQPVGQETALGGGGRKEQGKGEHLLSCVTIGFFSQSSAVDCTHSYRFGHSQNGPRQPRSPFIPSRDLSYFCDWTRNVSLARCIHMRLPGPDLVSDQMGLSGPVGCVYRIQSDTTCLQTYFYVCDGSTVD